MALRKITFYNLGGVDATKPNSNIFSELDIETTVSEDNQNTLRDRIQNQRIQLKNYIALPIPTPTQTNAAVRLIAMQTLALGRIVLSQTADVD